MGEVVYTTLVPAAKTLTSHHIPSHCAKLQRLSCLHLATVVLSAVKPVMTSTSLVEQQNDVSALQGSFRGTVLGCYDKDNILWAVTLYVTNSDHDMLLSVYMYYLHFLNSYLSFSVRHYV